MYVKQTAEDLQKILRWSFYINKNGVTFVTPFITAGVIRRPAQPCWNGGIWYRRTHGTESR